MQIIVECAARAVKKKMASEDILLPAATYVSTRLKKGPTNIKEDLRDIRKLLNTMKAEAKKWNRWDDERRSATLILQTIRALVEPHRPDLAKFIRETLQEAKETSSDREAAEDVLRPALTYVSKALKR